MKSLVLALRERVEGLLISDSSGLVPTLMLPSTKNEVIKAGGRLLERGEHAPGVPYAYVADPDGYVIEL